MKFLLGYPFRLIAIIGMACFRSNPEVYDGWFKMYREALYYQGYTGTEMSILLAERFVDREQQLAPIPKPPAPPPQRFDGKK